MAKAKGKKKKNDADHKARVQEKAQRKSNKKVKKSKEKADEPEEDIEAILAAFKKQQEEQYKVTEEIIGNPPSRRANATFSPHPTNTNELILFGGEFYDGQKVHMYNDLYRYSIDKDEWKRITSPNSPGPRSAHQVAIMPTGTLFLFGGEFISPNETQFFHYKDFWSFDLKTNQWDKLEVKQKPSARSGHRMAVWKNFIVLFGGFYDNYVQTNYYDDLWVFDTLTYKWTKIEVPESSNRPTARSGFCFIPCNDGVILYGGYCKQYTKGQRAKGIVHTDTWLLKMNTDLKGIKWEKRKKSGFAPTPRSGATMAVHKNRGILFGGVYDEDVSEEKLESTFYNELFTYQIDNGRWFPLNLRKSKQSKKAQKAQAKKQNQSNNDDNSSDDDSSDDAPKSGKQQQNNNDDTLEDFSPRARYNAMTCVQKGILYIYGGILEIEDKEYTLDDFWSINVDKMTEYTCMKSSELDEQVWLGEQSDDDDDEDDEDDEDEDEEDEDEDEENDEVASDNEEADNASVDGKAKSRKTKKKEENKTDVVNDEVVPDAIEEKDEQMMAMNKLNQLLEQDAKAKEEDALSTPNLGESLRDFYARTTEFWARKAFEEDEEGTARGKALRRDGFSMAEQRYQEYQPILQEIEKLKVDAGLDENDTIISKKVSMGGSDPADKMASRNRR
ncbi:galactose oxidase [Umbelopsis sp. PMI_123]|nr:galactose oxidase [Umbelopsis sp. PMI_123]